MKRDTMIFYRYGLAVVILTLFVVTPSVSAPRDKNKSPKSSKEKVVSGQQNKKDFDVSSSRDSGKKNEKNVKKKVVKKAGGAAAVGVAGKKINSGIKGSKKDD